MLRLPFAIFDLGTGWVTRSFMLLQFLGALIAAYAILRELRRQVRGASRHRRRGIESASSAQQFRHRVDAFFGRAIPAPSSPQQPSTPVDP